MEGACPLQVGFRIHFCCSDILDVGNVCCIVASLIFRVTCISVIHGLFFRVISTVSDDGFSFAESTVSYCEVLKFGQPVSLLQLLRRVCLVV
jgi:hypothetical protein